MDNPSRAKRPQDGACAVERSNTRPARKLVKYHEGDVVRALFDDKDYTAKVIDFKGSFNYELEFQDFDENGDLEYWTSTIRKDEILEKLDKSAFDIVVEEEEKEKEEEEEEEGPSEVETESLNNSEEDDENCNHVAEERRVSIIFQRSSICDSFQHAFELGTWHVGEKDSDGDFALWGTYSKEPSRGLYREIWQEKESGLEKAETVYTRDPMNCKLWREDVSSFDRYILHGEGWEEWKAETISVGKDGFRLPSNMFDDVRKLLADRESNKAKSKHDKSTIAKGKRGTPRKPRQQRGLGFHTPARKNPVLCHMMMHLALSATSNQIYNYHGKSVVRVCAAIVETNTYDDTPRIVFMREASSIKGSAKVHAEEIVLKQLGEEIKTKYQEFSDGSTKHLLMVVLHGAGGKQDGSVCAGCVRTIRNFIAEHDMDPAATQIVHPVAQGRYGPVGPMAAIVQIQRGSSSGDSVNQLVEFYKCKENSKSNENGVDSISEDVESLLHSSD